MSVPLKKYYVLQRSFMSAKPKEQFNLLPIEAKDSKTAWAEIEENISETYSQEWLLTKKELEVLKEVLNGNNR